MAAMLSTRRHFLTAASSCVIAGAVLPKDARRARADELAEAVDSPVASARYFGVQFMKNDVGVTGADGATSTLLPSGDSLWVFGDTIEGPFTTVHGLDLTKYRSNTGAVTPRQAASQGINQYHFLTTADGKRPRQLIPFAPAEDPSRHRVWGIHGTCVGSRLYLFYHRITLLEGVDVFVNFKLDGMGIARADVSKLEFERLTAPDGSHELWKGDVPTFGVFTQQLENYLYLWGSLATGMHLARTRPEAIEDLTAYEYLVNAPTSARPDVKPEWSRTFAATASLFDSVPNEMSASYNHHLKQYVAFHSLHREPRIVMRTAPNITGPWSKPHSVYRPTNGKEGDLIYAAKEHPELASDSGRVLYLTFVNSSTYAPELVELTLR
jgi:hypothetical protein